MIKHHCFKTWTGLPRRTGSTATGLSSDFFTQRTVQNIFKGNCLTGVDPAGSEPDTGSTGPDKLDSWKNSKDASAMFQTSNL